MLWLESMESVRLDPSNACEWSHSSDPALRLDRTCSRALLRLVRLEPVFLALELGSSVDR